MNQFAAVPDAEMFDPQLLRPGAVVAYQGIDYVVRGSLILSQGPYTWYEHLLDGGNGAQWLGVEIDDGELGLVWWTSRKGAGVYPTTSVSFEGIDYEEQERGHARFSSVGTTGLPDSGEMRYIDYADFSGQLRLGFEGWSNDDSWEMSTGQVLLPGELLVYPAPSDA